MFSDYVLCGALIDKQSKFIDFRAILFDCLQLDERTSDLQIKFQLMAKQLPMVISDDHSLRFYIRLRSETENVMQYPICTNPVNVRAVQVEDDCYGDIGSRSRNFNLLENVMSMEPDTMQNEHDQYIAMLNKIP